MAWDTEEEIENEMITFKPFSNPILFVGDNPSLHGGLSRIGRDLASLACTLPQFRVGYLARGYGNARKLPFTMYPYPETGWGAEYIQGVWEDFSGGEDGIIMTLDDPSRRHWFVSPMGLLDPELQKFLGSGRNFKRWGYFPIDSVGPNFSTLSRANTDCIMRYDRVLAASEWGRNVMITSGRKDADWLPHGIWADEFRVHYNTMQCGAENWKYGDIHVGCVMANQSRKDFPAAFECFAVLKQEYGNKFHAWLHTDAMIGYWNVYALATDYGIGDSLEVTQNCTDDQLALRYSACDCTILPSGGEGFGYPIAESLACGTACIVADYAGGAGLVEKGCRVQPVAFRVDTQHNIVRAVLSGCMFATFAKLQIEAKRNDWEGRSEELAKLVSHLDWKNLRYAWEKWLLGGLIFLDNPNESNCIGPC